MKRILYTIAALLVLLVGGGAFALSLIDTASLRQQISDATEKATGKPLVLAEVPEVSFMPLGVRFAAASWGMQDGKAAAEGISVAVDSGTVTVQLTPLFLGRVLVDEVILHKPHISIRPEAPAAEAEAAAPEASAGSESPTELTFELAKLQITNGSVSVDSADGQHLQIEALNATIADLRPNTEAGITLSMHLAVGQKPTDAAAQDSRPTILQAGNLSLKTLLRQKGSELSFTATEVHFTPEEGFLPATAGPLRLVTTGSLSMESATLALNAFSLSLAHTELSLSGQATLQGPQAPSFKGNISFRCAPDKALQSLAIKAPLAQMPQDVHLESPMSLNGKTLDVPAIKGAVDTSSVNASLHVQMAAAPDVRATLTLGDLDLDKYLNARAGKAAPDPAKAAPAPAADKTAAKSEQGKIASPPAAASLPTLDITIKIASLTAKKAVIQQFHTQVLGKAGRYTASPLAFTLASGGRVETTASVDLPVMRYTLAGTAQQINVGALLRAMQGASPLNGIAQADFTLACAGASVQALKSSLSGKGLLVVRDVVLQGVNILPKDSPAKGSGDMPNNFEKLQVPFTITDGIVNSNPFTLHSSSVTAKGQATVRLPQEDLNMQADIALLGITLPVVASGPFSNVSYGLDPKKVFQGVLTAPVKGTGNLLKKGGAGAENVGGALKGLFGR